MVLISYAYCAADLRLCFLHTKKNRFSQDMAYIFLLCIAYAQSPLTLFYQLIYEILLQNFGARGENENKNKFEENLNKTIFLQKIHVKLIYFNPKMG